MMKANLLTKTKIAKDTMQFDFGLQNGELIFRPGQFLSIKLPKVRTQGDEGNVHYFSIVSSPDETTKFSIATRLSPSAFKQYIFGMALGEEIEVGGVGGEMFLPETTDQHLVLMAGGIGITPFMSMITYAHKHQSERQITLLYSNRHRTTSPFLDELEKMAKDMPQFKLVATMTEDEYWPGERRPIDHELIKEYVPEYKEAQYMVAGPPAMVLSMANNFDRLGITKDHFILEEFFGY